LTGANMKFSHFCAAILLTTLVLPNHSMADGHGSGAHAVAAAISDYWDARNTADHKTVANLESSTGMLGTNSDGSFHKPVSTATPDDWKRNMAGQQNKMQVFYPEVAEIAEGVAYARYYLEGMVGDDAEQYPYRTRVTNVWVLEEDGQWRIKAMHFSNAGYGGTHRTQSTDFED
jgi:ketosteroid isomerase-like protein